MAEEKKEEPQVDEAPAKKEKKSTDKLALEAAERKLEKLAAELDEADDLIRKLEKDLREVDTTGKCLVPAELCSELDSLLLRLYRQSQVYQEKQWLKDMRESLLLVMK